MMSISMKTDCVYSQWFSASSENIEHILLHTFSWDAGDLTDHYLDITHNGYTNIHSRKYIGVQG